MRHLLKRLRETFSSPTERNMLFFALEGGAFSVFNTLVNSNNSLFITRLGATDFQLSLNTMLPQLVGMLVLLPGGLIADRLTNKRRMVIWVLFVAMSIFFTMGFVPMMGDNRLYIALGLMAVSAGPMTLYNTSWQAYFSDVISPGKRNATLSLRTRIMFVIAIVMPLVTGVLLASVPVLEDKLKIHQGFFFVAVCMMLVQIFFLSRVSGGSVEKKPKLSLAEIHAAMKDIIKNKQFLFYGGIAILFYMTWHVDWNLYFIGQIRYLEADEAWLSYANVGNALVQFATIGFWSKVNERKGVRFGIIFGPLSMTFVPLCFFVSTALPLQIGRPVFVVIYSLANFGFATVSLNLVQCLLQVVNEKYKTLSISIYTIFVALSNALMPMAGVQLYTVLGGNLAAFLNTFYIITVFRIVVVLLFVIRYKKTKGMPM